MSAFAYAKLIWVAQPIEEFVSTLLAQRGRPAPASPEQSLFLSGLLDSMDAMQTILFLEAEFGVDFSFLGLTKNTNPRKAEAESVPPT